MELESEGEEAGSVLVETEEVADLVGGMEEEGGVESIKGTGNDTPLFSGSRLNTSTLALLELLLVLLLREPVTAVLEVSGAAVLTGTSKFLVRLGVVRAESQLYSNMLR